ncbi:MAG: 5-formyltetrahydrofolate cyclo-ligase [Christensenellaceae bacterium]|nr:5-formyltetrahydrofolate cyclo-ligase [Christensenellaceae bacterium]
MNMDDKRKIRKKMLSLRGNLKKKEVSSGSDAVCARIMELEEYKKADSIFCYIAFRNEISLSRLITDAIIQGKKVYVPVVSGEDMLVSEYSDILMDGELGTVEPKDKVYYDGEIDLAIIPATACDRLGGRLGFGGGYYDKFLAKHKVTKLAAIYDFQLVDELPLMPHDILMDIVVCPGDVLRF